MSPIIIKLISIGCIALALFGYGVVKGRDHVQAKWDAEKQAQANQAETLRLSRQTTVNNSATKFAVKAQKDRVIVQTIIKEVDRYVPITDPVLSGGFRLLHDAAATGEAIDDSRRANAAPVAPSDVARTLASNYAECRYEQERVTALQAIVRTLNGDDPTK